MWFPEILRVLLSRIYTILKALLAFFKVRFRKWVPKTFFAVTFENQRFEENSWHINFCGKGNQYRENFCIPGNCFDKISYPSNPYFPIIVYEKLLVNDK